jgi:hypothetical protein
VRRAALTSSGGWWMQDAAVRAKDSVDDGETWGQRSARTRRLARRKESLIGGAMRRLAGSEGAVAAYLSEGKRCAKGRMLRPASGIYSRRREREVRWSCTSATRHRRRAGQWHHRRAWSPLFWDTNRWALVRVLKVAWVKPVWATLLLGRAR